MWIKLHFSSNTFRSIPSKHMEFLSHHIHQKMQWGIIFQISRIRELLQAPHQHSNRAKTPLGITQCIPKRLKIKFHRSWATEQWNRIWGMDSPFALHRQHQSSTMTRRLLRLSVVRMRPKVAVQTKDRRVLCIHLLTDSDSEQIYLWFS